MCSTSVVSFHSVSNPATGAGKFHTDSCTLEGMRKLHRSLYRLHRQPDDHINSGLWGRLSRIGK